MLRGRRALGYAFAFFALVQTAACSRKLRSSEPLQEPHPDKPLVDPARHADADVSGVTDAAPAALPPPTSNEGGAQTQTLPAPDMSGKTVLHVGDSMVGGDGGLTKALERLFKAAGARFFRDYRVSESIASYDRSPKLKALLARHNPDIVIVTLGANDVFLPYPAVFTRYVKSIVARIGARECYWMGPPLWRPDTGIVHIIRDNVAPCVFFDGSDLSLERRGDGIHPTDRGGEEWAARFWETLRARSTPDIDGGSVNARPGFP